MEDEQKNKEGKEFNAAREAAIKKARELPGAIYDNLDDWNVTTTNEGVILTKKEKDPRSEEEDNYYGYAEENEEKYYATEDGDVKINRFVDGGNDEYFPPQLSLEDIARLAKDEESDIDKKALMVEKGVNPKTTSPDKLKQYLFGDSRMEGGTWTSGERKNMSESEYIKMLMDEYTELWNEAEEKKISASEILKSRATERAKKQAEKDKETAVAVLKKIEEIPETPKTVSTPEANPQTTMAEQTPLPTPEPPSPPKKGFFKRLFGGK